MRFFLFSLLLVVAARAQQTCLGAATDDSVDSQTSLCPTSDPYCVKFSSQSTTNGGFCSECATQSMFGGCSCDSATSYCTMENSQAGRCIAYTKLNFPCFVDGDCQRQILNAYLQQTVEQPLLCVNSRCKPCKPSNWAQYTAHSRLTEFLCEGYDAALSNQLGRYATKTMRPGTRFTCDSNGNIVYLNSTVNFAFGYPSGDPANWSPTTTGATGASTTGAAVASTSGGGITTAANSDNNENSLAYNLLPVHALMFTASALMFALYI